MSHELWIRDDRAQAVINRKHGKAWWESDSLQGIPVEHDIWTVEELEQVLPLGFVIKCEMQAATKQGTMPVLGQSVTVREFPENITIDGVTAGESFPLGPVSNAYGVVQDQDVARIALASGRPLSSFILMDHGRRSAASVRLDDLTVDPNGVNDRLERFLGVFNDHTGQRNLLANISTIRTVCANTEAMAIQGGRAVHKLRHSAKVEDRIPEMTAIVAEATEAGRLIVQAAEQMLRVPGNPALDAVLDVLVPVPEDGSDRIKTRRKNVRDEIASVARGPLAGEVVGWNGWAVYNGVTEWLDHHRTVRGASNDAVARIGQAMDPLAPAHADRVKAHEAILALV